MAKDGPSPSGLVFGDILLVGVPVDAAVGLRLLAERVVEDPLRPLIVSEGFEQSEAELIDHASHGDDEGTDRILDDAFSEEAEADRGVYGDADEEDVSEDET